jgi:uncharacterized protein (TIRG00374 family)
VTTAILKKITNQSKFISRHKDLIIISAKILIAIGLLTFAVNYIRIDSIITSVKESNSYLILAAFCFSFLNIYLQFYKWKLTSEIILQETKKSKILASLFYGLSAGAFTPARIGEYFGRAIVYKDKSLVQVTLATLLDKIFPLLIILFFGSLSSILFIFYNYNVTLYLILGLFIVVFTLFYFVAVMIYSEKFWNSVLLMHIKSSKLYSKYFDKLNVFENLNKKYVTKMLLVSMLFYLCFLIQYALLVTSFSHQNNYMDYLWAGILVMFTKTVFPPISIGELGIREGASVYFITQFGLNSAIGFNASIFLFLVNILFPALIGLVFLIRKNND